MLVDQNLTILTNTTTQLRKFFSRHCLYVPDKEIQSLIERYDKELTGKISYNQVGTIILP